MSRAGWKRRPGGTTSIIREARARTLRTFAFRTLQRPNLPRDPDRIAPVRRCFMPRFQRTVKAAPGNFVLVAITRTD